MTSDTSIDTQALLNYAAEHFDTFSYLNDNEIAYPYGGFKSLIALGTATTFNICTKDDFDWNTLDEYLYNNKGKYIIGYLNYQLKNKIEYFKNELNDTLNFPLVQLYVPQYLFLKEGTTWTAYDKASEDLLSTLSTYQASTPEKIANVSESVEQFSHTEYLTIVARIKEELAQGNIYEMNFCNNYTGSYKTVDYIKVYQQLNEISPMPFSALHKHNEYVVVSASPERFIKKENDKLISQPIKGTAAREINEQEDLAQQQGLELSLKERTENIMIVDLVRNDLSKICEGGTVSVKELCRAYTFKKVHQLISTIEGKLEDSNTSFSHIMKAMFPMGSMTGAPKYKAMQLIDELEVEGRGLFSGTLGYIAPNGDFDFNVIIRSILFNEEINTYQYHAGSAITMASDAELEYQECRIKTLPIRLLLDELRAENKYY